MRWILIALFFASAPFGEVHAVGDAVKKEAKEDRFKAETVRGVVRNATTSEVTLDVAGKTMAVQLTPDCRITIAGREGKATDLKVGQEVRCTHVMRDGQRICREIVVIEDSK